MPNKIDFSAAAADAQKTAADIEAQASEVLWGHVLTRAAQDEGFRQDLAQNPEQTVTQEAQKLNVTVGPAQLEAAKALFSQAVPGIDSKKIESLIFGTIEDVRKSFKMTLQLSQLLFYVGIALLIMSAIFTWIKGAAAGSIFGAGGVISLVTSLIRSPLDRIRNAGANLVQIQMVYLAYYNLLYLLGSRGEHVSLADARNYAQEFRESATSMVSAVQSILQTEETGSSNSRRHVPEASAKPRRPPTRASKSREASKASDSEVNQ